MATDTSRALVDRIAAALAPVGGARAVVLGGSRARGLAQAGSDYDIGLYYRGSEGLDFDALDRAAAALDDGGPRRAGTRDGPLMTRFGDWGAWVDGGGWLTIGGVPVDILYRDLDRVERAVDEAHRGAFTCAYHWGHPHGFVSHMYAGEIAIAEALHDPEGAVAAAKARLMPYPPALRAAVVARFGQEGRFFLGIAQKAAARGDLSYVTGCAYRALACLLQVVFALNGEWLINEKGALAMAAKFAHAPKDFRLAAEGALAELAAGPQGMLSALKALGDLFDETDAL
jgi:nucleotidyltransferase-like protein